MNGRPRVAVYAVRNLDHWRLEPAMFSLPALALCILLPTPVLPALSISGMAATVATSRFPLVNTNPGDLSDGRAAFHNVVNVTRDFGPDPEDIAIDGWVTRGAQPRLEEVRIWYVRHDEEGRRHPFTRKTLKNLTIGYHRVDDGWWKVGLAAGSKQYIFDVELSDNHKPVMYAEVRTKQTTVPRCQVTRARLVMRRILGIPIGLAHVKATCIDPAGQRHHGKVVVSR